MITLRTNTRGKTAMTTQDYSAMTGPQLVEAYNTLAESKGLKPIKRFADHKTAVRRVQEIATGESLPKASGTKVEKVLSDFGTRNGTNRESLIKAMAESFGHQVAVASLIKAVYGKQDEKMKMALGMVMKGAFDMIKKGNLPYKIVYDKEAKTYGLYKK